jgi:hypothetical protein
MGMGCHLKLGRTEDRHAGLTFDTCSHRGIWLNGCTPSSHRPAYVRVSFVQRKIDMAPGISRGTATNSSPCQKCVGTNPTREVHRCPLSSMVLESWSHFSLFFNLWSCSSFGINM